MRRKRTVIILLLRRAEMKDEENKPQDRKGMERH